MGSGNNLYAQQQQARQLRAIERSTAAAAGQPVRKLSWTERHILGVKDPKPGRVTTPQVSDAERIAELEARVAALEDRVGWAMERIAETQAGEEPTDWDTSRPN